MGFRANAYGLSVWVGRFRALGSQASGNLWALGGGGGLLGVEVLGVKLLDARAFLDLAFSKGYGFGLTFLTSGRFRWRPGAVAFNGPKLRGDSRVQDFKGSGFRFGFRILKGLGFLRV